MALPLPLLGGLDRAGCVCRMIKTKQLFQKWLLYGIGTMLSMGVLAAMVSIASDMCCDGVLHMRGLWHDQRRMLR